VIAPASAAAVTLPATLAALTIVTSPRRFVPPTVPANATLPVPAVNVRFGSVANGPASSVLAKTMSAFVPLLSIA
jgi:hypothetical protein